MAIFLVRHGRAADSIEALDPGLGPEGLRQAEAAGELLAGSRARRLVVSPLRRTRETAAPIARALGVEPEIRAEVAEVFDPSVAAGARRASIGPLLRGRWSEQPHELQAWRQRVLEAVVGIASGPGDAVVVSHLVAIGAVLGAAVGEDLVRPMAIPNASVARIDVVDGALTLLATPSVEHLPRELRGDPAHSPELAGIGLGPGLVRAALAAPAELVRRLPAPASARPAGVVVPVTFDGAPSVLVVQRSARLRDHPGELGFPGGKLEPGDADLGAAAWREAEEELGIGASCLERLGTLLPVPVITGRFVIHPFVAALRAPAPLVPSGEIERVLSVPLLPLISGEQRYQAVRIEAGAARTLPHFRLGDRVLYGASAVILYELLERVAAALGRSLPEPELETELPWGSRY